VVAVGSLVKARLGAPPPARGPVRLAPAAASAIAGTQRLSEIALEGSRFALSTAAYTFKYVGTSVSASVQETKAYQSAMALAHRQRARAAADRAAADAAAAAAAVAAAEAAAAAGAEAEADGAKPVTLSDDVHKAKVVLGTVLTSCLGVYRTCKAALWEFTDDLKDLTVDLAGHYYGGEVAGAAASAFEAARNVGTLVVNVDSMPSGPTNVALTVVKESSMDILSLEEWLSGAVLAHGYVEVLSPIATWVPQWLLLRASALLIYNVRTRKATRPNEVVTLSEVQASGESGGAAADGWAPFCVATTQLTYRLRVRGAALRGRWAGAIAAAVAAHKARSAPRVVLGERGSAALADEQAALEAWNLAVTRRVEAWEARMLVQAAQAVEQAESWAALRAWAGEEAAAGAAEAAAEVLRLWQALPAGGASLLRRLREVSSACCSHSLACSGGVAGRDAWGAAGGGEAVGAGGGGGGGGGASCAAAGAGRPARLLPRERGGAGAVGVGGADGGGGGGGGGGGAFGGGGGRRRRRRRPAAQRCCAGCCSGLGARGRVCAVSGHGAAGGGGGGGGQGALAPIAHRRRGAFTRQGDGAPLSIDPGRI